MITGDNFAADQPESACAAMRSLIREQFESGSLARPDVIIAGPVFQAGRYGMACGLFCRELQNLLGVPAVTAMFSENPAIDDCRLDLAIVLCGANVMYMKSALELLAPVVLKLARGEPVDPETDHVVPRGLRRNVFVSKTGAERAIDLLMLKLNGEPFVTEYSMPRFDHVPPANAIQDLTACTVGLVTSGGIVPRGNPDRIASASARNFGRYSVSRLNRLTPDSHQTVHGGYDPTFADADPNRVLPLDALRELEQAGHIGRLHDWYYATVGNATSVDRARQFGQAIAGQLISEGVQAVILTST